MERILLKNAKIVMGNKIIKGSLLIEDSKIKNIFRNLIFLKNIL